MNDSIDIIINEIQNLIKDKKISELIDFETDNIYNKSAVSLIIKRYIDKKCLYNLDILKAHNITLKFIPIDKKYNCYEAMSFSNNSLYNIAHEKWNSNDQFEVATLKKQLDYNFLFIPIIKIRTKGLYNKYTEWKVGELSFWRPNLDTLNLIGEEWSTVKDTILTGVKIKMVKYGSSYRNTNNLPKQSETSFIHLRPHAKNSFDYDIPYLKFTNGNIEITKQSFWLNKKYINLLLDKYKWKMSLKEE